jgi:hypothetical protein
MGRPGMPTSSRSRWVHWDARRGSPFASLWPPVPDQMFDKVRREVGQGRDDHFGEGEDVGGWGKRPIWNGHDPGAGRGRGADPVGCILDRDRGVGFDREGLNYGEIRIRRGFALRDLLG